MKSARSLLLCSLLAGGAAVLHAQDTPAIKGYVTRAASPSDFDVNGIHVLCGGEAGGDATPSRDASVPVVACPGEAPRVGDSFAIHYTVRDTTSNAIYATRIDRQRKPAIGGLSGSAVIDAMPAEQTVGGTPTDLTLRADGYRIRITPATRTDWGAPLHSLADVKPGDWIRYKGKVDQAGVLVASSVQIGPNEIGDREQRLRANKEYDPSAIPADAKQNFLKDAFSAGFDAKRFPPYKDAALQARIERIGDSLVPAYQRALPASDPAKADFRFQLIDTKLFSDALTSPGGTVLLPHQVAERIQNDSQLAAVLADGIARVIERQEYRTEGKIKASYASMLAIPLSGYAAFGGTVASEIQKRAMEQRGRVSLSLLHDAGYDIAQAPVAWWLLASEKPKPLSDVKVPDRSAYLYRILRETWSGPAATPAAQSTR